MWGCRIVWCILTSWYLVSLLPVSIIHVSDIFLVGFWSWEVLLCGAAGAGTGRRPGLGFRFPVKWWDSPPPSGDLEPANQYAPSKSPRERWKARGRLSLNKSPRRRLYQWNCFKFEQKPAKFVPIGLLCKHVAREVCTNRIALQICNQSLCNPYVICW